jgi:hypothetical protein
MRASTLVGSLVLLAALAAPLSAGPADVPPWRGDAPPGRALRPSPASFERQDAAGLEIVWFDPLNALPCAFDDMTREADRVFGAMGVGVAWLQAGPDTFTRPPQVHAVLVDGREAPGTELTMGATLKDTTNGLHLWVSLPAVKRTLGISPIAGRVVSPGQGRQLARAVARVLAHEVIHTVAPSLPHAERGLMCHRLGRDFLLEERLYFDAATAAAVRAGSRTLRAGR